MQYPFSSIEFIFASEAIASSSDFRASHPFSVRCSLPPLLPEGRSLSSSESFLNLLISADAWGTLIPVALATSQTVELLSARYLRILLLFLLLILTGGDEGY